MGGARLWYRGIPGTGDWVTAGDGQADMGAGVDRVGISRGVLAGGMFPTNSGEPSWVGIADGGGMLLIAGSVASVASATKRPNRYQTYMINSFALSVTYVTGPPSEWAILR